MNNSLEETDSKYRLISISKQLSMPNTHFAGALVKRGRILYEEDDIEGICNDMVIIIIIIIND